MLNDHCHQVSTPLQSIIIILIIIIIIIIIIMYTKPGLVWGNLKFCFGISGHPASGWRVAVPAHRESMWSFGGRDFSGAGCGLYVYECVGL
jgi:hypothetical protein